MKNYVKFKRPFAVLKITKLADGTPTSIISANNLECEALISNKAEIPKTEKNLVAWVRAYESGAFLVTGFTINERRTND